MTEKRMAMWANGMCKTCGNYTHSCKCEHPKSELADRIFKAPLSATEAPTPKTDAIGTHDAYNLRILAEKLEREVAELHEELALTYGTLDSANRNLEHQAKLLSAKDRHLESLSSTAYTEAVLVLLNHIENVVDDANWEKIDPALWNAVTIGAPVSAIKEPSKSRRQIVFDWFMQEPGYWGGTEEVARVDELLAALDASTDRRTEKEE